MWKAPIENVLFLLNTVFGIAERKDIPGFEDWTPETASFMLSGIARFAEDVLAPLNQTGDAEGCTLHPEGGVSTPVGFRSAWQAFVAGGWNSVAAPVWAGGHGIPAVLSTPIAEFINSANQGFAMYTGFGGYVAPLFESYGTEQQKEVYLSRVVSGEWGATMALTEPHCGTDLGMIRTRAKEQTDGSYRITGNKIFISGGEHDLTDNIVHLVLAWIPGSPSGTRGLSLFLVPKFIPRADGSPGVRNGVTCSSVEHKMGLRASATCAMNFDDARGWIIGKPDEGMAVMFLLMNNARRATGVVAVGAAEAACQLASAYAKERLQSRAPSGPKQPAQPADALSHQPDVRRMLMKMQAVTEASRAFLLWAALLDDLQHLSPNESERSMATVQLNIITPVVKAVVSDLAFETAITAQQIFGGHGYIVETGIEQYPRDIRILMLAEGANGIQAMDLVLRKLGLNSGAAIRDLVHQVNLESLNLPGALSNARQQFDRSIRDVYAAIDLLTPLRINDPDRAAAASYDFMRMLGLLLLGYMWVRITNAVVREIDSVDDASPFLRKKLALAEYFIRSEMPETGALLERIRAAETVLAAEVAWL